MVLDRQLDMNVGCQAIDSGLRLISPLFLLICFFSGSFSGTDKAMSSYVNLNLTKCSYCYLFVCILIYFRADSKRYHS